MKSKYLLLVFPALITISAFAANQPVVAFTFECKNGAFLGEGPCPQGGRPGALILGSDGNFYGTAQVSAEGSSTPNGGTVFSVTASGKFTLLHTFLPGVGKDYPEGNVPGLLVEGADGKIYGTTLFGGIGGCNGYCGNGVLYRVNRDGSGFQILHEFCSETNCVDGGFGAMVAAPDGNIYGSSMTGGTGNCGSYYQGCGTIFRVTPASGAYEVVLSFEPGKTGEFPSRMSLSSDGTLYGLAFGATGQELFHFTPSTGKLETKGLPFPSINSLPSRGEAPVFGANGHLYGLYHIYATPGMGVYEVHTDGSNFQIFPFYTHQEGAGSPDGLTLASDGTFWMANYNGTSGYGNIVQISPANGQLLKTVSLFGANAAVGTYPAEILQTKDGTFWLSTYGGGTSASGHFADGTVFHVNLGLPPR